MKPTLKQIFDFGLEIVEKETDKYIKSIGEYSKRYSKRYSKQIIIYSAINWFNYTYKELSDYTGLSINNLQVYCSYVKKSNNKQSLAEELFDSLIYVNNKSFIAFRAHILKEFRSEGNNIRYAKTELEKWLINRLYEIENK